MNPTQETAGGVWGPSDLGFEWPKSCLALDLPQVLEVVRANYDTLTLKLQDGLDQYERYSEQHKEAAFFKELVSLPHRHLCLYLQGPFPASGLYCAGGHLGSNHSLPKANEIRLEGSAEIGCATSLLKQSRTGQ